MTKNKFLDDLINRLEEISKNDRGINLKAEFKAFDDSELEFLKENIDEVIERIKTFAKEAYEHLDMTVDDVPEYLRDEIASKGYDKGYEAGFESFKHSEECEELIDKAIAEFQKYMDFDDVPEDLYALIYEDGERAGYEQGSFAGEKVIVPAYVGEWIENIDDDEYLFDKFKDIHKEQWQINDLNLIVRQWVYDECENQLKLLSAIVNGYEIEKEKEKLYRIFEPVTERYLVNYYHDDSYAWHDIKFENYASCRQKFTEQEIKNLDERLWAFAVEVTE